MEDLIAYNFSCTHRRNVYVIALIVYVCMDANKCAIK